MAQFTKRAIADGWIDEDERAEIEAEAAAEIEAAVRFARDSPFPDPSIAAGLVYAT